MVGKHRGNLVKSTGDGIVATFDGPGRAVRCALAFGSAAKQIGLPVRAGLHTGEIEIRGNDIGGIAVHAAARVMSHCGSDEVLVSRVVTDLVAGAGLQFAERGSYELKGLPGKLGSICGERIVKTERTAFDPRRTPWTILQINSRGELVTVPSCDFAKCRQRLFNHLIGCRQTDSEVVGRIHHTTGQDEDITIGKRVPLPLRIAINPFAPEVEGTFWRKNRISGA